MTGRSRLWGVGALAVTILMVVSNLPGVLALPHSTASGRVFQTQSPGNLQLKNPAVVQTPSLSTVNLTVAVVDSNGYPVQNADVNVSIPSTGWSSSNATNGSGDVAFSVPQATTLIVEASYIPMGSAQSLVAQQTVQSDIGNVRLQPTEAAIPTLHVSLSSSNGTCPMSGFTRLTAMPSGGVGHYNFTWIIDDTTDGIGPVYNLTLSSQPVQVSLSVNSTGMWYGSPKSMSATLEPTVTIERDCGTNITLGKDNGTGPIQFAWSGQTGGGYLINGSTSQTLLTDVTNSNSGMPWASSPSWFQNLVNSSGYVPPWWGITVQDRNWVNETGTILQPSQSGLLDAALAPGTLKCEVGGNLSLVLATNGLNATAADLITLAYADLGVLDPLQQIDPDGYHGLLAELLQSEILSLSEQGVLSLLGQGLEPNTPPAILQDLYIVLMTLVMGLADLPITLLGTGYDYLVNSDHMDSTTAGTDLAQAIAAIDPLSLVSSAPLIYGELAFQWTSLVAAQLIQPTSESVHVSPFQCAGVPPGGGGGGGGVTSQPLDWLAWIVESYWWVGALFVAVVLAILLVTRK